MVVFFAKGGTSTYFMSEEQNKKSNPSLSIASLSNETDGC